MMLMFYLAVGRVLDDAPHVAALHAFDAHYPLVYCLNTPEATCTARSTRATQSEELSAKREHEFIHASIPSILREGYLPRKILSVLYITVCKSILG